MPDIKKKQRNGNFVKAYERLSGRKIDDNDEIQKLNKMIKLPKALLQKQNRNKSFNVFFGDYNPQVV
jgi:hypothetical protein